MSSSGSESTSWIRQACWLIAAIVIVAAGSLLYLKYRDVEGVSADGVDTLKQRLPRTHVHALGRLEPAGTILQLAPQSGNEGATIEQLLVSEGDDVEKGATLAIFDNRARRLASLQEADARLEATEAKLAQVRAGAKAGDIESRRTDVRLAEEQSKVARRELDRDTLLEQRKAITTEQLELKQWEFDRLQLEQLKAMGVLNSLKEVRDVDVKVAEKEVLAAKAAVVRARAEADASELRAPVAGRILRIHTHAGEKIADSGILEMGNVRQMEAVAEVFEADVAILAVGMTAEVRLDASEEVLTGEVADIGNLVARKIVLTNDPVSDTDARVIEVRIRLDPVHLDRVARLSNARVEVSIRLAMPDEQSSGKNRVIAETAGKAAIPQVESEDAILLNSK